MTTSTTTPMGPATEHATSHGEHEPKDGRYHPFAQSFTEDLALIRAGEETLWWDETGTPAPWPQDFLDPAAGWTNEHDHQELEQQEKNTTTDTPAPF